MSALQQQGQLLHHSFLQVHFEHVEDICFLIYSQIEKQGVVQRYFVEYMNLLKSGKNFLERMR